MNITKDELPSDYSSIHRKAFSKRQEKMVAELSWHNISIYFTRMQIPLTIKFTVTTLHVKIFQHNIQGCGAIHI
jgi:hypothetical protein